MKKLISSLLLLVMIVSFAAIPVSADNGYDPKTRGSITVTVSVPEGFDEVVYLSLMDSAGTSKSYAILPESNYLLVEEVICGYYLISAYVNNDPMMEYVVLRNIDEIAVVEKGNPAIELTVTGGPSETEPADPTEGTDRTEEPTDPAPTTEPTFETTVPEETEAPSEPATAPSEDIPSEPTDNEAPSEPSAPADTDSGKDEGTGRPFWLDALISLGVTAVFVGIIFGVAFLYRRFGDHF